MTKAARLAHSSGVLQPGSGVSWWVGPRDQPDCRRTGVLIRRDLIDELYVWVRPTDERGEVRMLLADLDGPWRERPTLVKAAPELHPALELPAPTAESIELLRLLDAGVEIQPGQRTVLAGVLGQLRDRGFIVEQGAPGSGVWDLTPKGREVIDG